MSYNGGYRSGGGSGGGSGQNRNPNRSFNKYGGGSSSGNYGGGYSNGGNNYRNSNNNNFKGHSQSGGGGYQQYDSYKQGGSYNKNNNSGYAPKQSQQFYRNSSNQTSSSASSFQDSFQIWMGDLDPKWDEKSVIDIWSAMGETPASVKILRSDNYKPPYCFVSFTNSKAVSTAMQKNGMQIPGSSKVFKLNWASGGGGGGGNQSNSPAPSSRGQSSYSDQSSVFVGDLSQDLTESVLFEAFNAKFPNQVKQVKIMMDVATRTSKGFGFIRFDTVQAQQRAIKEMNGAIVKGRPIKVSPAAKDTPQHGHSSSSSSANSGSGSVGSTSASALSKSGNTALHSNIPLAQSQPALNKYTDPSNTTISIKGISDNFSDADLVNYFLSFGDILEIEVAGHQSANIKFLQRSAAESAILAMNGSEIRGDRLIVNWGKLEAHHEKKAAASFVPKQYGRFISGHENTNFKSIKDVISLKATEITEPLPINTINENYIREKSGRFDIF